MCLGWTELRGVSGKFFGEFERPNQAAAKKVQKYNSKPFLTNSIIFRLLGFVFGY